MNDKAQARPEGCCCPPPGHNGIWAAGPCPVHQGLRRLMRPIDEQDARRRALTFGKSCTCAFPCGGTEDSCPSSPGYGEEPEPPLTFLTEDEIRDLASSSNEEALQFGLNEDVFLRLLRGVNSRLEKRLSAPKMPALTDAMKAVIRNEKDVYGSEEELYAALVKAAGTTQDEPMGQPDPVPVVDLQGLAWNQIITAVGDSRWIPEEYMMNDWVSDICAFLRGDLMPHTRAFTLPTIPEVMCAVFEFQHTRNKNVTGTTNWAANVGSAVLDLVKRVNSGLDHKVSRERSKDLDILFAMKLYPVLTGKPWPSIMLEDQAKFMAAVRAGIEMGYQAYSGNVSAELRPALRESEVVFADQLVKRIKEEGQ